MFEFLDNLRLSDFRGGITDNPLSPDLSKFRSIDNLVISLNGMELEQRPGTKPFFTDYPNPQPIFNNVDKIFYLEGFMFCVSNRSIYYIDVTTPAGWTELVGPVDGNPALPQEGGTISIAYWKGHAYIAMDTGVGATPYSLRKVYIDENSVPQVRTVGLPYVWAPGAGVGTYSVGYSTVGSPAVGAKNYSLYACYTYTYTAQWNGKLIQHKDFGPITEAEPLEVSGIEELSFGAGKYVNISFYALTNSDNGRGENIYFQECWDLPNIDVEFYAREGSAVRKLARKDGSGTAAIVAATATSISTDFQNATDSSDLYTEDGTKNNIGTIASRFIIQGPNHKAWVMGTEEDPGEVRQTHLLDLDASPEDGVFKKTLEDPVSGGGFVNNVLVAFTDNTTNVIEGEVARDGSGSMSLRTIDHSKGCIDHASILNVGKGLLFFSKQSICLTDGYSVKPILTNDLREFYSEIIKSTYISKIDSTYDAENGIAYWLIEIEAPTTPIEDLGTYDTGRIILSLDVAKFFETGVARFSTMSGFSGEPNCIFAFRPAKRSLRAVSTSSLLYGSRGGFLYQFDKDLEHDYYEDESETDVTQWHKKPIIWRLEGLAYDFGDSHSQKWVYEIGIEHSYTDTLGIQASCRVNNSGRKYRLIGENYRDYVNLPRYLYYAGMDNFDENQTWGNTDVQINQEDRVLHIKAPLRTARCYRHQFRLTNLLRGPLYTYEDYDRVTLDVTVLPDNEGNGFTCTLNSGTWPADVLYKYIAFEMHGYQSFYLITGVSGNQITFDWQSPFTYGHYFTADETFTNKKWKIYWVNPDEKVKIKSVDLKFIRCGAAKQAPGSLSGD